MLKEGRKMERELTEEELMRTIGGVPFGFGVAKSLGNEKSNNRMDDIPTDIPTTIKALKDAKAELMNSSYIPPSNNNINNNTIRR